MSTMNYLKHKIAPLQYPPEPGVVVEVSHRSATAKNDHGKFWQWKMEHLFAAAAYNINIFTLWNLPALCCKHGGVAFLVPYFLTLLVCGWPLYYVEFTLGYSTSGGGLCKIWNIAPLLKGIAGAAVFINFFISILYAVYASWAVYFLAASLTGHLPWQYCDLSKLSNESNCSKISNPTVANATLHPMGARYNYGIITTAGIAQFSASVTNVGSGNHSEVKYTQNSTTGPVDWHLPSHEYFQNTVLRMTDSIDAHGDMRYENVLCLLLVCMLVFACQMRGAHSTGKTYICTVMFSHLCLIVVLIRTAFEFDGAILGWKMFFYPEWGRLLDIQVWGDAALLAFFTLFQTWNALANISSKLCTGSKNTCFEDAFLSVIGSGFSSFLYGLTVSALIGILSQPFHVLPEKFITEGPNLVFVTVAQAMEHMSFGFVWSIFFYLSVTMLIFGTLLVMQETLSDAFFGCEALKRWRFGSLCASGCVVVATFLVALALLCGGGFYAALLFSRYCNWWNIIILALIELMVITPGRLQTLAGDSVLSNDDSNDMKYKSIPGICICVFDWLWRISVAIVLLLLLAYSFYAYTPTAIGGYKYPLWAEIVGWLLTTAPLLFLPICAVTVLAQVDGDTILERLRNSMKPKTPVANPDDFAIQHHDTVAKNDIEENQDSIVSLPKLASTPPGRYNIITTVAETLVVDTEQPLEIKRLSTISATEYLEKPGKVNRGTQMTRDVALQTGDQNGDGAVVELDGVVSHTGYINVDDTVRMETSGRKHKHRHRRSHRRSYRIPTDQRVDEIEIAPPVVIDVNNEQQQQQQREQQCIEAQASENHIHE